MTQENIRVFAPTHTEHFFAKEIQPIDRIRNGEMVWIETLDCYGNRLKEEVLHQMVKLEGVNPVTGAFEIEGAEPGDTLAVEILDVQVADTGTMYLRQGVGMYGDMLDHPEIVKIPVTDREVFMPGGIRVAKRPMIGVIGVAPSGDPVSTESPGRHGGNMDTIAVTAGATLYLPVSAPGALFALGDLHAAMGDGETGICGVEVSGRVKVKVSVIKGRQESWPILRNDKEWMAIASGLTLDEAAYEAGHAMFSFLRKRTHYTPHDMARFLSAAGDLQISQLVNPLKTVRMTVLRETCGDLQF